MVIVGDGLSPGLQWSRGRSPSEIRDRRDARPSIGTASMEPRAITLGDPGTKEWESHTAQVLQWSRGRSPSEIPLTAALSASDR